MSVVRFLAASTLAALAGCTTPYHPAVPVAGFHAVSGIGPILNMSDQHQVDVIMVHGMGTHTLCSARNSVTAITAALHAQLPDRLVILDEAGCKEPTPGPIEDYSTSVDIAGGKIHFKAIVWSPLTTALKQQLKYNNTDREPNDCAVDDPCKPQRAALNGNGIDFLLNDALSDALIYQGQSKDRIRNAVAESIAQVLRKSAAAPLPLVLITESLGSKIVFDALDDIRQQPRKFKLEPHEVAFSKRIRYVFMGANQLPLLGLADQDGTSPARDAMSTFLASLVRNNDAGGAIEFIAFTDPNDLLSFRLRPSRYAREFGWARFSDVLVSNTPTLFGKLANPYTAHIGYLDNPDVVGIIACGTRKWDQCK